MFSLLETILELTFRDGLEYARRIIFNRRFLIESLSFEWCVYSETAAQDPMNALARYRGEETSHRTHASHS